MPWLSSLVRNGHDVGDVSLDAEKDGVLEARHVHMADVSVPGQRAALGVLANPFQDSRDRSQEFRTEPGLDLVVLDRLQQIGVSFFAELDSNCGQAALEPLRGPLRREWPS